MTQKQKPDTEADTREKILCATGELISQNGVNKTSLADICNKVGISKGTLYYHYKAKEEIVFEIADRHLSQITNDIFSLINNAQNNIDAKALLKFVFDRIVNAETRGKSHLYLISDVVTSNEKFKDIFKKKYFIWRSMIEEGLTKALNKKSKNTEAISHIILAMLDGFIIQRLVGIQDIPYESIFELLINGAKV